MECLQSEKFSNLYAVNFNTMRPKRHDHNTY